MSKLLFRIIGVASLVVLASVFISPQAFWLAGIFSLMIPVVLTLHLILLIYFLFKPSPKIWYSLFIVAFGIIFLNRTIAIHGPLDDQGSLSVLSYNVRVFNVYSHLNENYRSSKNMMKWIKSRTEDVICFQEFYYEPKSEIFSTVPQIQVEYPYFHFQPKVTNHIGAQFGMAIFSRRPIVNKGSLEVTRNSMNDILYVDLDVGTDTVRVYNVHLESMSIDEDQLTSSNRENWSQNLGELFGQLRYGFSHRAQQIDKLVNHMQASPYKVILVGDLNDVPYSYSYQKLKKYLHSSFENAGKGFGFTFNGKLFFLRIDNQFYGEGIRVNRFETLREIKFTDHYPISAIYSID